MPSSANLSSYNASYGTFTVILHTAVKPLHCAVICVVPSVYAITRPLLSTSATDVSELVHFTIFCEALLGKIVATSCNVLPKSICASSILSEIDFTGMYSVLTTVVLGVSVVTNAPVAVFIHIYASSLLPNIEKSQLRLLLLIIFEIFVQLVNAFNDHVVNVSGISIISKYPSSNT